MRPIVLTSVLVGLLSGCTHTQLKFNTTHQADTLNDIYRQQVLDNLAMFADNPYAVPHFAFPNQGSSNVTDDGNLGGTFNIFRESLGFGVRRNMAEAWTLDPIRDPDKLRRMRCAYQHAVGACSQPCNDCCKIEKAFYGKGSQKVHVLKEGLPVMNSDGSFVTDPLTGMPFVNECGMPLTNPRTGELYSIDEKGCVSIPVYDCNGPCSIKCGWYCVGCKKDVPHDCRHYSGHYHGTYVWVLPKYRHHLAHFVLTILDYALKDPSARRTKEVVLYVNQKGDTTTKSEAHVKVTATIPIGEPNRSILNVGDCHEPGTPVDQKTILKRRMLSGGFDLTPESKRALLEELKFDPEFNSATALPPSPPSLLPPRKSDSGFGPTILQERLFLDALAPR